MRPRTLRVRLLVALLALGFLILVFNYVFYRLPFDPYSWEPCAAEVYGLCGVVSRNKPVSSLVELAAVLVLLLVASRWIARWVLAPLRDLVPVIDQMGPQNLGYRIRPQLDSPDEIATLSVSLNAMMDRISAGYEGQRRFAANASHELRTPLALQRMLIEVGMAEPLTEQQSALLVSQLLQANERNERLIDGLLTLSQAQQGPASRAAEQLDDIVEQVLDEHREPAAAAGVTFTSELSTRPVHGDRILLERLVRNLVHNAVKYNRPGGTVHVSMRTPGTLTVTNSGPDVRESEIARLFEPFTRLAGDRIDHSGGSGLGLAIARSIVQSHGGTIVARPGDEGGLRVTVALPTTV